ncbi:hypothetical protein STAIW_v1c01310 [Spiroplasma taiwanense CT-1]|uniref:Uncharacterized protein n=1 Tax=Spiroplasma taiwanense CT-1 TaxID=1276220 RepID=S5LYR3_9MOLU|nr:hypothetical protein STAIW_v1c01310 [Spiroplasma taiwanense CT-1]
MNKMDVKFYLDLNYPISKMDVFSTQGKLKIRKNKNSKLKITLK